MADPKQSKHTDIVSTVLHGGFIATGALLLCLGIALHRQQALMTHDAVRAEGTVTAFVADPRPASDSDRMQLVPVFRIQRITEKDLIFLGTVAGSHWSKYHVGDSVRVLYNPDQLEDARIENFPRARYAYVFYYLLGTLAITLALSSLLRRLRATPPQD